MRTIHLCVAAALVLALAGCSKKVDEPKEDKFTPSVGEPLPPGPKTLQIEDEVVGTGKEAHMGDTVKVLYTGTLMNGRKFDSTHDRGDQPAEFKLEEGGLIKGWLEGMKGMKVGGKRKLTIPSDMGYGAAGHPPDIPGDAGLKFEIELVAVE
ncbi:MAG TPA: FKBP-type peptidyl-prolyl cis-trans isomerase [Polyangiaceae bacterium]|jgi:FKBP-type peptidyl-prolyl cis-trans isomerase